MIENYANAVYVRESVSVHEIGLPHVVEEVPQLCFPINTLRQHHSFSHLAVVVLLASYSESIIGMKHLAFRSMWTWPFLKRTKQLFWNGLVTSRRSKWLWTSIEFSTRSCMWIAKLLRMTPFSSSTVPRISDIFVSIRPSSLDAVFFGHIARIMCYSAHLRNHLFNYPNLVDYYDGIMKRYFAPSLGVPTSENALIVETIGKIDC